MSDEVIDGTTGEIIEGPRTLVARSAFDASPQVFRERLDAAGANRKLLLDWIRENLVDGTPACFPAPSEPARLKDPWRDNPKYEPARHAMKEGADYGRIYTRGGWSKPTLFKSGSEKILGMLRLVPTFPNLGKYEEACISGVQLRAILLRCEILDGYGSVVAHGSGAANVTDGDINKALKMAEKSAQIDATLRCAGISEVLTQDVEDTTEEVSPPPVSPQRRPATPSGQPAPQGPPQASDPVEEAQRKIDARKPPPGPDTPISEPQRKRLWAIWSTRAEALNLDGEVREETLRKEVRKHGCEHSREITRGKGPACRLDHVGGCYDAIVKWAQTFGDEPEQGFDAPVDPFGEEAQP